jgi:hypothetical protein
MELRILSAGAEPPSQVLLNLGYHARAEGKPWTGEVRGRRTSSRRVWPVTVKGQNSGVRWRSILVLNSPID